jgi:hypothetical protein
MQKLAGETCEELQAALHVFEDMASTDSASLSKMARVWRAAAVPSVAFQHLRSLYTQT